MIIKTAAPKVAVQQPAKTTAKPATPAPVVPATITPTVYVPPSAPHKAVETMEALTMLIYGERKIGKTSMAAKFPGAFIFAFEPGFKGQNVYADIMADPNGYCGTIGSWAKFRTAVDWFVKGEHEFHTPIIDTVDVCFMACQAYVCFENGWKHPTDKEAAYGRGWDLVNAEFIKQMGRLVNKYGVIFISHAAEKDVKDHHEQVFSKIMPSMTNQAKKYISAVVDVTLFYGYHGDQRLMTIRGSDMIDSGNRLEHNFFVLGGKEKYDALVERLESLKEQNKLTPELEKAANEEVSQYLVHSIPCGISSRDAYYNLQRAFNNRQPDTGAPGDRDNAVLSDRKAPLKTKEKG